MKSKIESKLRLDFFLTQGLELVCGDVVEYIHGTEFKISESPHLGDWNTVESCNKNYLIKSLAPRENKGVQPVGDDVVVDVVYCDFDRETGRAGDLEFAIEGDDYYDIKTWKPNLDALIELQEKPKVAQVKPEVVGYRLIECGGVNVECTSTGDLYSKAALKMCAANHACFTGEKSKFRPVYKNATHITVSNFTVCMIGLT